MAETKTRWLTKDHRVGPPTYHLISGRVPVALACWNDFRSKDDAPERNYRWRLDLPGSKREGHHETLEGCQAAAEAALTEWLAVAGLAHITDKEEETRAEQE